MSTQLILYPQNYSGYSFSSSMYVQQYVSNADFTSTMAGTIQNAVYNSAGFANFMASAPPIQAWQGFHSNSGTGWFNNTSAPTISSGTLTLNGTGGVASSVGSICGVYQTITGLTVGQLYDLVIDHPTGSGLNTGYFYLGIYGTHTYNQVNFIGQTPQNTPVGSSPTVITNSGTSTTHTFVAHNSTMQLSFAWLSDFNTGVLNITKISIEETGVTPVQVFHDLFDGQVICDLYQEQDIPLTLSVDNFTNVAEKTQSYSKDFDLPATKRNNKIFTHIFEVTKTISDAYDFNPYISTKAALKQNGVLLFEGSLRLIEIVDKNGEISYNVNLFADSIALAEVLGTRTFSDLEQVMAELDHDYSQANIISSFAGLLALELPLPTGTFAGTAGASTTSVLKYPFVDWTGTVDCTNAMPEVANNSDVFRPFIKLKYLVDNIFFQAGFSYTSAFFDSSEFNNMYMDFNWGNGNAPQVQSSGLTDGTSLLDTTQYATTSFANCISLPPQFIFQPPLDFDTGTNQYVSSINNNNMVLLYKVILKNEDTSSRTAEVQIVDKGVVVATSGTQTIAAGGTYQFGSTTLGAINTTLNSGDILAVQIKADVAAKVRISSPNFPSDTSNITYNGTVNTQPVTSSIILNSLRGELNQWEFLRSIMTMFNLITMPDPENPNNILIEPYNDVFGEGASAITPTERDWTYKLDITDINLKPLDLKRKTVFRYEEDDDDYAFGVYKRAANGFLYGSKTFEQTSYNLIEGEEEIVAESFAATICKPLQDNYYNFYVPVIYSGDIDSGFESFENIPRILIDNGLISESYKVNGTQINNYLAFSHTSTLPSTFSDIDINFGNCALFTGASPTDNLYNTYYAGYYEHLYNPNTRIMTAKVNLNPTDINTFKFFDVVTIKNRQYRINKIDYKPNALSTVEFILLN